MRLQALLLERPLLLEQLLLLPLLPLLVHRLLLPPGIDLPLLVVLVVLRQAGQGDSKAEKRHHLRSSRVWAPEGRVNDKAFHVNQKTRRHPAGASSSTLRQL